MSIAEAIAKDVHVDESIVRLVLARFFAELRHRIITGEYCVIGDLGHIAYRWYAQRKYKGRRMGEMVEKEHRAGWRIRFIPSDTLRWEVLRDENQKSINSKIVQNPGVLHGFVHRYWTAIKKGKHKMPKWAKRKDVTLAEAGVKMPEQ